MASETSRRGALAVGVGLIAVAAGWQMWIRRERAFAFQDLPGLPGWRRLEGGAVSVGTAGAVFAGLDGGDAMPPLETSRLCDVLFPRRGQGVPVAIFTDVNCPFCREMLPRLATREAAGTVSVTWLEWPIFGEGSEAAARMLLAAERQGKAQALRTLLYTRSSGAPGRIVREAGLDPNRLRRDMEAPGVAKHMQDAARAAELLALPGTPAMMVGRTLIIGAISGVELDRLISIEKATGPLPCNSES